MTKIIIPMTLGLLLCACAKIPDPYFVEVQKGRCEEICVSDLTRNASSTFGGTVDMAGIITACNELWKDRKCCEKHPYVFLETCPTWFEGKQ